MVIPEGSYAAVGLALAHNARLAGYDVHAVTAGSAELANTMAKLTADDVLVAISFWRLYESTVRAANEAYSRGTRIFAQQQRSRRLLVIPSPVVVAGPRSVSSSSERPAVDRPITTTPTTPTDSSRGDLAPAAREPVQPK